jgi:hypothetical protein
MYSDGHSRMLTPDRERERAQAGIAALIRIAEAASSPATTWTPGLRGDELPQEEAAARRPGLGARLAQAPWPLLAVLAVQAGLSLRLIWTNTAFTDEALYLWAGHLEIAHWLHGSPIPPFATYFSGAPVIYPPLGALADSVGGLAAARMLSLCFMLSATLLLWAGTSKLFGRRAAFYACGLWSVLGPTLHLGAFATYDAMALFLMALAAWCVIRAGTAWDATGWMLAAAVALALANATTYSSAIFDPVVVIVALLAAYPRPGGKPAFMRGLGLMGYTVTALVLLLTVGGGYYMVGIGQTVLTRASGSDPAEVVLTSAWTWTAAIAVTAIVAPLICAVGERVHRTLLLITLAGACALVPMEQARIHTLTSLDKHTDFGAWFAAIAAGYAVDATIAFLRPRGLRAVACGVGALALVFPARMGTFQVSQLYSWPNAAAFVTVFGHLIGTVRGPVLIENSPLMQYYSPIGADWERVSNTWAITLPSGKVADQSSVVTHAGSPLVYSRYIQEGYFSAIALDFGATPQLDQQIVGDLSRNHDYRVIAKIPYGNGFYTIWLHRGAGSNL